MHFFRLIFLLTFVSAIWMSACNRQANPESVLATFNGGEITQKDYLDDFLAQLRSKPQTRPDETNLKEILTNRAMRQIANTAALDFNVDQDSAFIVNERKNVNQILLNNYYQQEIVAPVVTDSLVQQFYRRVSPQFKMSIIQRVLHDFSTDKEIQAQKDMIDFIYEELQKGRSFQILAKKYSQDKISRAKGGDMGFLISDAMKEPALRKTMDELRVNHYSRPVRGYAGFYILQKGRGLKVDLPPFDQVKEKIRQTVYRSRFYELKNRA